jgi:predicted TIM-barrel fold metal-dependent hydrolase
LELFDACCYFGRYPTERLAFNSVQGLLSEMDRLGIERALVCHTLAWQNAPEVGNARLMAEIADQPRLEPCWVVLPNEANRNYPRADDFCEHMLSLGVRAVRLCPRDQVFPLVDWMAGNLLAALSERHFLVLLDVDQVVLPTGLFDVDPAGWRSIAWLCKTYPGLSVLLTRIGYRSLRILLPLMQTCPNLFLDLSYFATHQGVEEIISQFGPGRLVFGTSQPLVDPGGALTRLAYAGITSEQRELIAHRNLERLLGQVGSGARQQPVTTVHSPAGQPSPGSPEDPSYPPSNLDPRPAAPRDLVSLVRSGINLRGDGIKIIDAHGHLGPYRNFYIPEPGVEGILRVLDQCGVAMACLAAHLAIGPDWILGNRLTAEAVATHPDRLIGYAVADPHEPELIRAELTHAFDALGLKGIKLHPDIAAYPIGGKGFQPAWELAAERECLVLVHTFHGSRYCDPTVFGELAERYPNVPIVLVHSGALTAAFEGAIAVCQAHPNLYLDLSGSFMTGQWITRMVKEVGAERVIFSSDIPFIDLRYSLGRFLTADITPAEQALVMGGNIRRLLKL